MAYLIQKKLKKATLNTWHSWLMPMQTQCWKQGGSMPRPKSELTHDNIHIGVRLTKTQWDEWKRLGGPLWLRKQLANSLEQKKRHEQTAKTLSQ